MILLLLVFLALYSYLFYPLLLVVFPRRKAVAGIEAELPLITMIIAAHNEEARIGKKLKNTAEIDYPLEKLEVLVASDCSTDQTDAIVTATDGVTLIRADQHLGKEYAQSLAVKAAKGDILVFSDAATEVPADSLRNLAALFADPSVGAVSSVDKFVSENGGIVGEGLYVRYEMWLRSLESRRAGLVGLSGSFFAARSSVCQEWDIVSPSDFNTALNCARNGLVAISSDSVVGVYKDIKNPANEYQRKVRTVIRGMTAISRAPEVLNPRQYGVFSFQVWSHKIMRWLVPWFLLLLMIASVTAPGGLLRNLALAGQLVFYGTALAGWLLPALRDNALVRVIFFFTQVNLAIAQAGVQFISGKRITTWKPSVR